MAFVWRENTKNIITVFASNNAVVSVFYKKRGSSVPKSKVSGEPTYRGDDIWEIETSLSAGDYIMFIVVKINDEELTNHYRLRVLSEKDYYSDGSLPRYIEWG